MYTTRGYYSMQAVKLANESMKSRGRQQLPQGFMYEESNKTLKKLKSATNCGKACGSHTDHDDSSSGVFVPSTAQILRDGDRLSAAGCGRLAVLHARDPAVRAGAPGGAVLRAAGESPAAGDRPGREE